MSDKTKYNEIERRYLPATELRVVAEEEKPAVIEGYAAVFNSLSEDFGGFREMVAPGCFSETIKNDDIRALVEHDPAKVIGRLKSGTLELEEDERGLKCRIHLPDTEAGRSIKNSIERGDVDQMSFGFRAVDDDWNIQDGQEIRTLKKVRLFDISPVTFPAYPETQVALRSLEIDKQQRARQLNTMEMELGLVEAELQQ